MKKITTLLFLAIILSFLCSCGFSGILPPSDRSKANEVLDDLIVALENDDKDTIKSMFAPDLLKKSSQIDKEIEEAIDFFDGTIISYEGVGTPASGEEWRDGELTYLRIGSAYTESIITENHTYELSFSAVLVNKKKTTQESVWRIWIGKEDGTFVKIGSDDYDFN